MKKKPPLSKNYLERIPKRSSALTWKADDNGIVTLEIENVGWANRIAQKLFHRPRISFIHLDRFGSFVWLHTDGQKNITELGKQVEEAFGEEAHPLYERLAQFYRVLDSYHFITWVTPMQDKQS